MFAFRTANLKALNGAGAVQKARLRLHLLRIVNYCDLSEWVVLRSRNALNRAILENLQLFLLNTVNGK